MSEESRFDLTFRRTTLIEEWRAGHRKTEVEAAINCQEAIAIVHRRLFMMVMGHGDEV